MKACVRGDERAQLVRAAIYLRVSTRKQEALNQERECLELAQARGWEPRLFTETASGVRARPVWESVKRLAHEGKVRAVVIWSLDRVGRRMFEIIRDVTELTRLGCKVVSVREPWLDRDDGLLLSVFSWVAQHEHQRISQRTIAGLARAAKAGRFPGRPRTAALSADATIAAVNLRKQGWRSWGHIARQLERLGFGRYNRWAVQRAVEADADPRGVGPHVTLEARGEGGGGKN